MDCMGNHSYDKFFPYLLWGFWLWTPNRDSSLFCVFCLNCRIFSSQIWMYRGILFCHNLGVYFNTLLFYRKSNEKIPGDVSTVHRHICSGYDDRRDALFVQKPVTYGTQYIKRISRSIRLANRFYFFEKNQNADSQCISYFTYSVLFAHCRNFFRSWFQFR